ncbi:MAG: hypothetical protein KGQ59_12360, partial [Bdellovibrionales bacterium]|nr:hypothetical protein [Bdellovibrionales bacterium]
YLPSVETQDLKAILAKIKSEDPQDFNSPFQELLKSACKEKKLPPRPKIQTEHVNNLVWPLEKNNEKVVTLIESGLSKGEVVGISYHHSILDTDSREGYRPAQFNEDRHASVILGDMKVCGEEYYILRNSWGSRMCKTDRADFDRAFSNQAASEAFVKSLSDLEDQKARCDQITEGFDKKGWSTESRYESLKKACMEAVITERARRVNVPFFCDEQDNYVIRKDYLKRGIFGATVLSDP